MSVKELTISVPPIESVRATIASLLSSGHPTVERTAHALGYSPRTLQRRLHDSGTTYGDLVDRVRVEVARRLLEEFRAPFEPLPFACGAARSPVRRARGVRKPRRVRVARAGMTAAEVRQSGRAARIADDAHRRAPGSEQRCAARLPCATPFGGAGGTKPC